MDIDKWDKLTEMVAIIVGGIAAYYRFFKGRIYRGRLELSLAVTEAERDNISYLTVNASIKNIGASRIDIVKDSTAIALYSWNSNPPVEEYVSVPWIHQGTFLIFQDHEFLEAGEAAHDQFLVVAPSERANTHKVDLEVHGGMNYWLSRYIIVRGSGDVLIEQSFGGENAESNNGSD